MIDNSAAAAYLYGRTTYKLAELFTIGGPRGTLVLTSWPATLLGGAPVVRTRGTLRSTIAGDTSSLDVVLATTNVSYGGLPIRQAAAAGYFDEATLVVERVLDPGGSNIRVVRFKGWVQQADPTSDDLRIVAKDFGCIMERTFIPSRNMQPGCPYLFRSPACGAADNGDSVCAKILDVAGVSHTCASHANTGRFGGFPSVVPITAGITSRDKR